MTLIIPGRDAFRVVWMVAFAVALTLAAAPYSAVESSRASHIYEIQARSYEYSPSTLRVNPGDHVTIALTSMDYVHGIYIEGYNLNLIADPGQTARISFIADQKGTFRMRCSVTCGPMHPFMIGKLEVGESHLWLRAAALSLLAILFGLRLGRR